VALVTYGTNVEQRLALTAGNDPKLLSTIEALDTYGSTNMEAGLKLAYEVARKADAGTSEVRVFLFTDENPNVGATSSTEFSRIVADGATAGTALTIFGMGLGVRQDLMNEMAHLRGANAYTLAQEPEVPKLIDESWPWMASALAYELKVNLTPTTGFSLANTYGFPGTADKTASLDVSTVFLSRKKGGLLLQLAPAMGVPLTNLALSGSLDFKRRDGSPVSQPLTINATGAMVDTRGQYFAQPAVGKAVALAVLVSAMKEAATLYTTDHAKAVTKMADAVARITDDNKTLGDAAIATEVQLAADLLALMQKDAPQGNLYGK
jgi:Ca-activated chloride channel family protein